MFELINKVKEINPKQKVIYIYYSISLLIFRNIF